MTGGHERTMDLSITLKPINTINCKCIGLVHTIIEGGRNKVKGEGRELEREK